MVAAHYGAGRLATRALVLAGCCLGLMAAFWLLSGSNAHASNTSRAAAASSTPSPSGGLLSSVTGAVTGTLNTVTNTVNGVAGTVPRPPRLLLPP
jgi:hypothetical protein